MRYYKTQFHIKPYSEDYADILAALMSEIGFESFEPTSIGTDAYIQQQLWNEDSVKDTIRSYPIPGIHVTYNVTEAEYENWNKTWEEEGFRPIVIDDKIAVHNSNHTDIPHTEYDIVISPRQAFGTGSHQTTRMILEELYLMNLTGNKVVDAGTGTGILAIMCTKRGAGHVLAYDIDEWSVDNAKENITLNNIGDNLIEVANGDASILTGIRDTDLIIANINRNILLADMPAFHDALSKTGHLLLSGFYTYDIPLLTQKAESLGMRLARERENDGWAMLLFETDTTGRMDV